MLSIVTFKWSSPGYRTKYDATHVNTMRAMVARHYKKPHRFICITDNDHGIDSDIITHPIWDDYSDIKNPTWPQGPSCYRRLKVFSKEFEKIGGERFVCMDLDAVITSDLSPLFDKTDDIVTYSSPGLNGGINGALFMMTAGCRSFVWDNFDPIKSPLETTRLGYSGSDQGWMNACLQHMSAKWTRNDGICEFKADCFTDVRRNRMSRNRSLINGPSKLPPDARIVMFHGKPDPWDDEALSVAPWIRDYYQC